MIRAIELLRANADNCERQAKQTNDRVLKAKLFDMTAQWHWLAGKAADLYDRAKKIETT